MTIEKFHSLLRQDTCPSCMEKSLKKRSMWNGVLLLCKNCGGVPAICNQNGGGIVHMSDDINHCKVCGEIRPNADTHSIFWFPE